MSFEPAAQPPSVYYCGRSSRGCKGVTSRGIVRQSGASVRAGGVRGLHEALRLSHGRAHDGLSHDTKTVGNRSVSMSRNAQGHGPASLTRDFGHRLGDSSAVTGSNWIPSVSAASCCTSQSSALCTSASNAATALCSTLGSGSSTISNKTRSAS